MNALPKVGAHVRLSDAPELVGIVDGFGTAGAEPVALVRLARPRWTVGKELCVSVLAVHVDNVEHDPARRVYLEEKHLASLDYDGPRLSTEEARELCDLNAARRPAWMVDR